MIDLHLPIDLISNFFKNKEDVKDFKQILKEIDPEQKIDISYDRLKLQELFFNLNPQVFSSANFRKILFESNYKSKNFIKFAEDVGIKKEEIIESNKKKIIKTISNFIWGPNKQTRSFITNFQLDESLIPSDFLDNLELEEFPPAYQPYDEMFRYQSDLYHEALPLIKKNDQRFIIQVPTGGGKTKIGMELVCNELNLEKDKKILWVADRRELCEQATDAFGKVWRHKGKKKITLNRCWENFNLISNIKGSTLIVATIDKILSAKSKNVRIDADIIIFDEAHHASAPKYHSAIIHASKSGTRAIGLTATPGRSYEDEEENEELSEMFDDILLRIPKTLTKNKGAIAYLQSIGVLSKPIRKPEIIIPTKNFLKKIFTDKELEKLEKKTDYSLKDLEKIGKNHVRNIIIINKLVEIAKTGKQILFFGTSVAQSRLMYAAMKHLGFSGAHIDANTVTEFRRESIQKFKNSKIQILFNNQVLATGFDAPAVEVLFIARPTKSPVLLLQMIGRGMRGENVGGTKTFDLYYVKDGIFDKFQNLDELFEMFAVYFEQNE